MCLTVLGTNVRKCTHRRQPLVSRVFANPMGHDTDPTVHFVPDSGRTGGRSWENIVRGEKTPYISYMNCRRAGRVAV